MGRTKIDYLTHVWNPIAMRCTPCSPGCLNCWHLRMCKRLAGNPGIARDERRAYAGGPFVLNQKKLEAPLHWRKPARIGVQFMGDWMHWGISDDWIYQIWLVMIKSPQHTFFTLTKRPERLAAWLRLQNKKCDFPTLQNVFLGVTVCNQAEADQKIPELLRLPGFKKWVSVEPCLSQIDLTPWLYSDRLYKNLLGGHYEGEREGIFSASGNGLVRGGLRERNCISEGSVNRRESDRVQAIYENDPEEGKSREVHFQGSSKNNVYNRDKTKDGGLFTSDNLDDGESCGYSRRVGNKSQRRKSQEQFTAKPGSGNETTKQPSCGKNTESYGEKSEEGTSVSDKRVMQIKNNDPKRNSQSFRIMREHGEQYIPSEIMEKPSRLSWIVAGAETGPGARPAHPDWFRNLRDECQAAGVPFFLKKIGKLFTHGPQGRTLDGREWNETP